MRRSLCLALVLLPSLARAEDSHRWSVYTASAGALRTVDGSGGGTVSLLGMTHRLGKDFFFDLLAGEGYYAAPKREMVGEIEIGARYEPEREGFRPGLFAGFAHAHQAPYDVAVSQPVPVLMGIQKDLVHRTGLAAGAQLSSPELKVSPQPGGVSARFFARIDSIYFLGDGAPDPLYLFGSLGVSVGF